MLWFFEKDDELVRLETRYDNDTSEIVVTVHWPDGRDQTERFTDEETCRGWLVVMEQSLRHARWMRNGPPIILPYGWPNRT